MSEQANIDWEAIASKRGLTWNRSQHQLVGERGPVEARIHLKETFFYGRLEGRSYGSSYYHVDATVAATYLAGEGPAFALRRQEGFSEFLTRLGAQDIVIGDEVVDPKWIIKGMPPEVAQPLLARHATQLRACGQDERERTWMLPPESDGQEVFAVAHLDTREWQGSLALLDRTIALVCSLAI